MRILVSWLRDFVTVEASIQELADVLTMRGFEVSAIEAAPSTVQSDGDDAVVDLEITTNRPDCLSVFGIAREVSTIYDTKLRLPLIDTTDQPTSTGAGAAMSVTIDDPDLCRRYVAAVADVTPGPSPTWLAVRLDAAGVRPINNIVDITNYVMLEIVTRCTRSIWRRSRNERSESGGRDGSDTRRAGEAARARNAGDCGRRPPSSRRGRHGRR